MEDIIKNNVEFKLPVNNRDSTISLYRIEGEEFAKARKRGAFKDVDLIGSNFSALQPTISVKKNSGEYTKIPIYVSGKLKKELLKRTNNQV